MSKSFRYVSEFEFPSDKGYSGSAGQTSVKGYCRGGKVMKKADGGEIAHAKGAIRNERKEIQRVESKQKDAGQEIKRVRSEMAYDKNVVKDGYCGGGKVKKADGGTVAPADARKALMLRAAQQRGQGGQGRMGALGQLAQQGQKGAMRGRVQPVATPAMKDGGKVDAACKSEIRKDVHKHESAMHPGKQLTKLAKGGFNSTPLVGKKQEAKMGKVMGEFKSGDLHSGSKSGPMVKNRKQAIAIAMSEARNVGKKK